MLESHQAMHRPQFACQQTDDQIFISGPGARITFARTGDHWTHHLAFHSQTSENEAWTEIAAAVESDPQRDDPARVVSPVYQEIHRHEFAGDQLRGFCLLLTGSLFQHHFSAAMCLYRDPGAPNIIVLEFDIADRCRAPVSSLAATYLVRLGSSALAEASAREIGWTGETLGAGRLRLRAESSTTLALAEAGRHATRVQTLAAINPASFTQRLRYCWRWASTSDFTW
jgi:hypothetical protein